MIRWCEKLFLHEPDRALLLGALALVLVEDLLAKAQVLRGRLDVLVDVDVLERTLQAELQLGLSWMPLPSPWERMLVSFFSFTGLTGMSLSRAFSPTIMPM